MALAIYNAVRTLVSWITTIFFYLALIIIVPWILALVYDLILYLWRSLTYEIPYVGGRARGARPPRAPTLAERPPAEAARALLTPIVEAREYISNGESSGLAAGLGSAQEEEERGGHVRQRSVDVRDGG